MLRKCKVFLNLVSFYFVYLFHTPSRIIKFFCDLAHTILSATHRSAAELHLVFLKTFRLKQYFLKWPMCNNCSITHISLNQNTAFSNFLPQFFETLQTVYSSILSWLTAFVNKLWHISAPVWLPLMSVDRKTYGTFCAACSFRTLWYESIRDLLLNKRVLSIISNTRNYKRWTL